MFCSLCVNGTFSNESTQGHCEVCDNPKKPSNAYYDKVGEIVAECSYVCIDPRSTLPDCLAPSSDQSENAWSDKSIGVLCGVITTFCFICLCVCLIDHEHVRHSQGSNRRFSDELIESRRSHMTRFDQGSHRRRNSADGIMRFPFFGVSS